MLEAEVGGFWYLADLSEKYMTISENIRQSKKGWRFDQVVEHLLSKQNGNHSTVQRKNKTNTHVSNKKQDVEA
jgi:hypothetical protein